MALVQRESPDPWNTINNRTRHPRRVSSPLSIISYFTDRVCSRASESGRWRWGGSMWPQTMGASFKMDASIRFPANAKPLEQEDAFRCSFVPHENCSIAAFGRLLRKCRSSTLSVSAPCGSFVRYFRCWYRELQAADCKLLDSQVQRCANDQARREDDDANQNTELSQWWWPGG